MLAFGTLLTLVAIAVWLYALFDSVTCPEEKVRGMQKPLWVLVIVLLFVFGAVLWFWLGRPRVGATARVARPDGGLSFGSSTRPSTRRSRPLAPDDDIDFLRSLNQPRDGNDPT
jgi:hypothetical protein